MNITHKQVHDEDGHYDEEDEENTIGNALIKDVSQKISIRILCQSIFFAQVILVVEDISKVQFPHHHHKGFDERMIHTMEWFL